MAGTLKTLSMREKGNTEKNHMSGFKTAVSTKCSISKIRSHNLRRLPGGGREPVFFSWTPAFAGETAGRDARPTFKTELRDSPS